MSKKQFKSQASSSRVGFGQASPAAFGSSGFFPGTSSFGSGSSVLSYLAEQPDLTLISDPHVVVIFKNLSKKDSITKAKALEELQIWLTTKQTAKEEIEAAFLDAWVKVYPRTSIDVSRRVRQLAHAIQGQISAYCGKRIARHLPATVGPWLSGSHDGDKVVSRAAQEALNQTFPTSEKREQLLKAYQTQLIEFARDAVLLEAPQTLSDERTTSQDDSEAKYTRVVACNIAVITDALSKLDRAATDKCRHLYEEVLADKKTWEHVSSKDMQLRRAVLRLVKTCLTSHQDLLVGHTDAIAEAILSKSTLRHQTGTSAEFVETLSDLTKTYHDFWSAAGSSKTTPLERFQSLAKQGSQGGSSLFWERLAQLFALFYPSQSDTDASNLNKTLEALQIGINRKDEPRMNHEAAWLCYLKICQTATKGIPENAAVSLNQEKVLPIFQQYVRPSHDTADWTIPSSKAVSLLETGLVISSLDKALQQSLPLMAASFLERIQTSQPEQSKDYKTSQDALKAEATRWFTLQAGILKHKDMSSLQGTIHTTTKEIISASLALIESRKGKPYGAAAAVEAAVLSPGVIGSPESDIQQALKTFLFEKGSELALTASFSYLVTVFYQLQPQWAEADKVWTALTNFILSEPDGPLKYTALGALLDPAKMPKDFELPARNLDLQAFILRQSRHALDGEGPWPVFLEHGSASGIISTDSFDSLLADLTSGLSVQDQTTHALAGLQAVLKGNKIHLRSYLSSPKGTPTLQNILRVTESAPDGDAQLASELNTSIQSLLKPGTRDQQSSDSIFTVIRQGLTDANENALSVPTLVELALKVAQEEATNNVATLQKLLPTADDWLKSLGPFLAKVPPVSLALSSPLAGAVVLLDRSQSRQFSIGRDIEGYSAALRTAWYVVSLLKETNGSEKLPDTSLVEIYCLLRLTIQLAGDDLGLAGSYGLWTNESSAAEEDIADIVSDAQALMSELVIKNGTGKGGFVTTAHDMLLSGAIDTSPVAYQNARAFAESVSTLVDAHGSASINLTDLEEKIRSLRKQNLNLALVAYIVGYSQALAGSTYIARICNEIIADITGLDPKEKPKEALSSLVTLNTILGHQEDLVDGVAKQRVIFLVKHVVAWLSLPTIAVELKTETIKCLTLVLPSMNDIYGEHWANIFESLLTLWSEKGHPASIGSTSIYVPLFHASLKLYATLGALQRDENTNDDLKEVWTERAQDISEGLLALLRSVAGLADINNQPLRVFNELLARHISSKKPKNITSLSSFYSLMSSESSALQRTAFEILHRQIPQQQEQISLEAALDKKTARLPEELLSLIIQVPPIEVYGPSSFDRAMPPELQTYLSSWLLIFDHFRKASEKVQADYTAHVKEGGHLEELLSIISSFLGHSGGKPADVSKFDISTYSFGIQESPTKDVQWLLSHLYFLSLKRMPNLTKTWWRDTASRPVKISIEAWTRKYISPLLISDALDAVETWARTQDESADDTLVVKANRRTHEVIMSKEIDEQTMKVALKLPDDFPLNSAVAEGMNRVAVDERKWQSWLMNCQGVINFSNNSLIEGITTFRRNLAAQLKGHTECAICYSLVSADKQLPSKKCTTCKKLFHGSCLYRWFKSSNSSSCPLCRTTFNYG